jgi:hypothetical protein
MRALLSRYGSRGDIDPMVGGAERCDSLVATGMTPAGV